MKPLQYNGYLGSVDYSLEDKCLHGKILHINDLVTFEAETVPELEQEFKSAVDDYLETCEKLGRCPDKPFKGTFNVRMSPDQHREAANAAALEETTLNDFVSQAVAQRLESRHAKVPAEPLYIQTGRGKKARAACEPRRRYKARKTRSG